MGHRKKGSPIPTAENEGQPLSTLLLGKSAKDKLLDSELDDIFKSSVRFSSSNLFLLDYDGWLNTYI